MFALRQAKNLEIEGRKLRIFKSSENPQKQVSRRIKKFEKTKTGNSNNKKHKVRKQKKDTIQKVQHRKGHKCDKQK